MGIDRKDDDALWTDDDIVGAARLIEPVHGTNIEANTLRTKSVANITTNAYLSSQIASVQSTNPTTIISTPTITIVPTGGRAKLTVPQPNIAHIRYNKVAVRWLIYDSVAGDWPSLVEDSGIVIDQLEYFVDIPSGYTDIWVKAQYIVCAFNDFVSEYAMMSSWYSALTHVPIGTYSTRETPTVINFGGPLSTNRIRCVIDYGSSTVTNVETKTYISYGGRTPHQVNNVTSSDNYEVVLNNTYPNRDENLIKKVYMLYRVQFPNGDYSSWKQVKTRMHTNGPRLGRWKPFIITNAAPKVLMRIPVRTGRACGVDYNVVSKRMAIVIEDNGWINTTTPTRYCILSYSFRDRKWSRSIWKGTASSDTTALPHSRPPINPHFIGNVRFLVNEPRFIEEYQINNDNIANVTSYSSTDDPATVFSGGSFVRLNTGKRIFVGFEFLPGASLDVRLRFFSVNTTTKTITRIPHTYHSKPAGTGTDPNEYVTPYYRSNMTATYRISMESVLSIAKYRENEFIFVVGLDGELYNSVNFVFKAAYNATTNHVDVWLKQPFSTNTSIYQDGGSYRVIATMEKGVRLVGATIRKSTIGYMPVRSTILRYDPDSDDWTNAEDGYLVKPHITPNTVLSGAAVVSTMEADGSVLSVAPFTKLGPSTTTLYNSYYGCDQFIYKAYI